MLEQSCNSLKKSERSRAILSVLLGSAFIGLGPFFVEFSHASAETNTFYRLLVGALFFISVSVIKKQLSITPKFVMIGALGGCLLVLDLFLWNQSVLLIGAGLSTVLSNLEIVFLVLIGKIYFSEKTPNRFFTLCIFMVFGVGFLLMPVIPQFDNLNILGSFLAIGASLSYALYLFSIKYMSERFPEQSSTSMLAVICLTGCILLGVIMSFHDLKSLTLSSIHSAIFILINSFLSQVIAWWLISRGLRSLSLSLSGFLLLLQPALTFFFDCLFLSRNTHWLQLIGLVFLLGSVYLASQYQSSQKETHESNH